MQSGFIDRRSFLAALGLSATSLALPRPLHSLAAPSGGTDLSHDPERPEYHFLAPHNWMNDPNGPIWWKGKYHLFYQLNPGAAVWGDMHWGHAVSSDMVHWRHQPVALSPTPGGADGEGCFSGSAVVRNGVPTLIYTGVQNAPPELATIRDGQNKLRETQMLAAAQDDGLLKWKKQAAPVITSPPPGMIVTGFRDPCLWREADGWYMVLGSGERGKGGFVLLYRSPDLKHWEYLHQLVSGNGNGSGTANPVDSGEMWECPDFFPIGDRHFLLYSTAGKVFWTSGDYDIREHRFTVKQQGLLDHGAFYAPKGFNAADGRRILWGWIQETRPEAQFAAAGWAGMMSLPRELTVGPAGQLEINPAAEVEKLRGARQELTVKPASPFRRILATLRQELVLQQAKASGSVTIRLLTGGSTAWEMTLDFPGNTVHCGEKTFPLPPGPVASPPLRLFLDGSVIESFIGGQEAITSRIYSLKPGEAELEISAAGGDAGLDLWTLQAISPDRLTT